MRRIVAKEEYCMNCRLCEVHCLVSHSKSKDIIKAFRTERGKVVPRITVETSGPVSFAVQCRHCEDAYCLEACMTGAIALDPETGRITHDADRCVGCWMCIMVCPNGALRTNPAHHVVAGCDLCIETGTPACVEACPNEALYIEGDDE
ncbi:4Fe-4S dicluster domain-containing protein [Dethiosulfatarculus sandiegensis]|nr:4Fe-4S dicluster domain-containing protein [Dethiosulfatarculus sandiegensis]